VAVADTRRQAPAPSVALAVLALGAVSFALLQSLVAPALPTIQHVLDTSPATIGWMLSIYLLVASIAAPLVGRLGDMYGKRRMLLVCIGCLFVGVLVDALAASIGVMLAGRALQGLGIGIFPLAYGIIRDQLPPERVAGAIGLVSGLLGTGAGVGVILSGVIVEHLSFHFLFWLPLIPIALTALAVAALVPESRTRRPGRIAWRSVVLMTAGLSSLLIGISRAHFWGWNSTKTIVFFVAGALLAVAWVHAELTAAEPLIDMRVMRLRTVRSANACGALISWSLFTIFFLVPQLVQEPEITGFGFGSSVTASGLFLFPMTCCILLVGPLAGRIERSFGARPPLVAGACATAAGCGLLALAHGQGWGICVSTALVGVGVGLAFAAMANAIVHSVPPEQTSMASGMNFLTRTIGGAFGIQLAATLLAANTGPDGLPSEHGYVVALLVAVGVAAIGASVSMTMPRRKPHPVATVGAPPAVEVLP
jgi:EmrB/QacA subfamily drug resistance transporter